MDRALHCSPRELEAHGAEKSRHCGELSGASNLVGHFLERRTGIRADRLYCGQAHNDDQGEHHSVFNCCWPIFSHQET